MLKKKERLRKSEFDRFFSTGTRYHSSSLQAIYTPYTTFHASVVVPKKVARRATERNTLRRRVYDIVRCFKDEAGGQGVFIIIAKPHAAGLSYAELKEETRSLIGRCVKSR